MARISGVDLPKHKRGEVGLTYIFGIGRSTAQRILAEAEVPFDTKVEEWNDEQLNKVVFQSCPLAVNAPSVGRITVDYKIE